MYRMHDIEEIEGIGPVWGEALRALDLRYAEDLLLHPPEVLTAKVQKLKGFPGARMRALRGQARLMQVAELTAQHAEALCRAGRYDLDHLAAPHPSVIVEEIESARKAGLVPEGVDLDTAIDWQKNALKLHYTGTVAGTVTAHGEAVAGARVAGGFQTAETADTGHYWLPGLSFGKARIVIRAEGFREAETTRDVEPDVVRSEIVDLMRDAGETRLVIDEEAGHPIPVLYPEDHWEYVDVELSDLPEGFPLGARYRYRDGRIRLHGLLRRRVDNRVEVKRVVVPAGALPEEIAIGTVVRWRQGSLVVTGETRDDVRNPLLFGELAAFVRKP